MRRAVAVVALVAASASARADRPVGDGPPATPRGPPAAASPAPPLSDAQVAARAAFAAGNRAFEDNDFVGAVERYRAALAQWDQPAIRFNLAVALIELDRSREAYPHLAAALEHGEALGGRLVEARNYLRLVRARLSTVAITCPAAATCELDGRAIDGGATEHLIEPGTHALVARRRGYLTESRTLVLEPGATSQVALALSPIEPREVRRWSPVKPWLVFGAGAAVVVLGGTALLLGNQDIDTATAAITSQCQAGCRDGIPPEAQRLSDRGRREQIGGVVGLATGGAAVVTGAILVYLNRSRVELVPGPRLGLAVGGGHAIVTLGGAL